MGSVLITLSPPQPRWRIVGDREKGMGRGKDRKGKGFFICLRRVHMDAGP